MSKKIIILVIVAAILIIGTIYLFSQKEAFKKIELTNETALSLLGKECNPDGILYYYKSCVLDILEEEEGRWIVTVTYNGLYDDSVRATQFQAIVKRENGQWIKDGIIQKQKCQPNRGHQEFSREPCV